MAHPPARGGACLTQYCRLCGTQYCRLCGTQYYRLCGTQYYRLSGTQYWRLCGIQYCRLCGTQYCRLCGIQYCRLCGTQYCRLCGIQYCRLCGTKYCRLRETTFLPHLFHHVSSLALGAGRGRGGLSAQGLGGWRSPVSIFCFEPSLIAYSAHMPCFLCLAWSYLLMGLRQADNLNGVEVHANVSGVISCNPTLPASLWASRGVRRSETRAGKVKGAHGMPLHVRRSSDPSLAAPPLGSEAQGLGGPEEPSRKNPARWSTTTGFKYGHKPGPGTGAGAGPGAGGGTGSLERKGRGAHAYRSLPRDSAWAAQFQRESTRSSLSANHPMVDRWLDRQEQAGSFAAL
ncbi:unnamed protein product [Arctogadus glacialis]